jgi:hypothetical protein
MDTTSAGIATVKGGRATAPTAKAFDAYLESRGS